MAQVWHSKIPIANAIATCILASMDTNNTSQDILDIARAQNEAYLTAYRTGYEAGFAAAMRQAQKMAEAVFSPANLHKDKT